MSVATLVDDEDWENWFNKVSENAPISVSWFFCTLVSTLQQRKEKERRKRCEKVPVRMLTLSCFQEHPPTDGSSSGLVLMYVRGRHSSSPLPPLAPSPSNTKKEEKGTNMLRKKKMPVR